MLGKSSPALVFRGSIGVPPIRPDVRLARQPTTGTVVGTYRQDADATKGWHE